MLVPSTTITANTLMLHVVIQMACIRGHSTYTPNR